MLATLENFKLGYTEEVAMYLIQDTRAPPESITSKDFLDDKLLFEEQLKTQGYKFQKSFTNENSFVESGSLHQILKCSFNIGGKIQDDSTFWSDFYVKEKPIRSYLFLVIRSHKGIKRLGFSALGNLTCTVYRRKREATEFAR
jgi:hypothetical protein